MIRRYAAREGSPRGQALVELALVLPLFLVVFFGLIVLGLGLFYQQQVANAAREAARYAAIHSATSECPTRSWKDIDLGLLPDPAVVTNNTNCDAPMNADGITPASPQWPLMQAYGRQRAGFGFDENDLHFAACWSGYVDAVTGAWDAAPIGDNVRVPCTIGGIDPVANAADLSCPPPATGWSDDKATNLAVSSLGTANDVTVYACYNWRPPLAGFLLIPDSITLRATITQSLQHQR